MLFSSAFPSREAIVLFRTSEILRLHFVSAGLRFSKKISTRVFLMLAVFVAVVFFLKKFL
jgi:hypothetical protein